LATGASAAAAGGAAAGLPIFTGGAATPLPAWTARTRNQAIIEFLFQQTSATRAKLGVSNVTEMQLASSVNHLCTFLAGASGHTTPLFDGSQVGVRSFRAETHAVANFKFGRHEDSTNSSVV
jgi:hypothetical protein